MRVCVTGLVTAGLLTACTASEEMVEPMPEMESHGSHEMGGEPASVSAAAYDEAMVVMHRDMGTASADADETFMRMMIPHHQGAIDMAEIVLEHGTDEETRALARSVIESQSAEIEQMEAWMARREAAAN